VCSLGGGIRVKLGGVDFMPLRQPQGPRFLKRKKREVRKAVKRKGPVRKKHQKRFGDLN